jgi:hypothetical protein
LLSSFQSVPDHSWRPCCPPPRGALRYLVSQKDSYNLLRQLFGFRRKVVLFPPKPEQLFLNFRVTFKYHFRIAMLRTSHRLATRALIHAVAWARKRTWTCMLLIIQDRQWCNAIFTVARLLVMNPVTCVSSGLSICLTLFLSASSLLVKVAVTEPRNLAQSAYLLIVHFDNEPLLC